MIDFILAVIMGGVIGWLASIVMKTDAQQGIFLNIVVGAIGSFIGRHLFGAWLGGARLRDNPWDPMTWLAAFLGAVLLLAVFNLIKRGRVR